MHCKAKCLSTSLIRTLPHVRRTHCTPIHEQLHAWLTIADVLSQSTLGTTIGQSTCIFSALPLATPLEDFEAKSWNVRLQLCSIDPL